MVPLGYLILATLKPPLFSLPAQRPDTEAVDSRFRSLFIFMKTSNLGHYVTKKSSSSSRRKLFVHPTDVGMQNVVLGSPMTEGDS
jgi:hypothetical protein